MNKSEYQKLYELETTYWWHVGRRHILKTLVRKFVLPPVELGNTEIRNLKILDVGCGTGENIKFLSQFGDVTGVDISKRAIEFCKKRGLGNVQLGRAENLPFEDNSLELVTMLDLLEHIKDDLPALKEARRVLKPGRTLLVTVPSYQFLWSDHDEALGHKRRYSKKELVRKVRGIGFKIQKLSFAVTTLFPSILTWRIFQKLFIKSTVPKTSYVILPDQLNKFFINLLRFEAWALKRVDLPFGTSLICVAKKVDSRKY